MLPDDLPDRLAERVDPIDGSAVEDADPRRPPAILPHPVVVDLLGHEIRIRHRDQRVVEGADAGGSESDGLDLAFDAVDDHPVAHLERPIQDDGHAPEEVLE